MTASIIARRSWSVAVLGLLALVFLPSVLAVERFSLDGNRWRLKNTNGSISIPARVPGVVHLDLLDAGLISDPLYRYNEALYRWIPYEPTWTYSLSFTPPPSLFNHSTIELVFDGLDTIADVLLNGRLLASSSNMFRRLTLTVTNDLTRSANNLTVVFHSPALSAQAYHDRYPYELPVSDPSDEIPYRNFIRKAQSDFAWDWGPGFAPSGVWKHVELRAYSAAVIVDSTFIATRGTGSTWHANVTAYIRVAKQADPGVQLRGQWLVSVAGLASYQVPFGGLLASPASDGDQVYVLSFDFPVNNPDLWWPVGYGSPRLYPLNITLVTPDDSVSVHRMVGFRTMRVVREQIPADQPGKSMYFEVNGVPVYAKGSNLVPFDAFHPRVTATNITRMLSSALASNQNIIRVYPRSRTHPPQSCPVPAPLSRLSSLRPCAQMGWGDLPGRLGVRLRRQPWDPHMAGVPVRVRHVLGRHVVPDQCARGGDAGRAPPVEPRVPGHIRWEQVGHQRTCTPPVDRRPVTSHTHTLWCPAMSVCSEDETALGWFQPTIQFRDRYLVDYAQLYINTVRDALVREVGLHIEFQASSPTNGPLSIEPYVLLWGDAQSDEYGDRHFYDYDMDCSDVAQFPRSRFISEFGFQSFPSFITWRAISLPEDWQYRSNLSLYRQHHDGGQDQMEAQIRKHFDFPSSADPVQLFDDTLYMTQVQQGLCYSMGMHHWRRIKDESPGHTMGIIYWQLDDIWQAPTWASLEYGARWKVVHYTLRQVFAPNIVSAYVQPIGSPTAALYVYAVSDSVQPQKGTVDVRLRRWDTGEVVLTQSVPFALAALQSARVLNSSVDALTGRAQGQCANVTDCFVQLRWMNGSDVVSEYVLLLGKLSPAPLKDPQIKLSVPSLAQPQPSSGHRMVTAGVGEVGRPLVERATVVVSGSAPAAWVFMETEVEGWFTDNAFTLLPGENRTVEFVGYDAFDVADMQKTLKVRSVWDVTHRS